jgi:hypothetical protein
MCPVCRLVHCERAPAGGADSGRALQNCTARGDELKGGPQVGLVKVYQLVPILTRTPGHQVGLYKAHSGIKWWSSEKLEHGYPRV